MYRVQLSGNEYEPDREVGLHYQIHRGIGVHHAAAIRRGEPLRVNVFVGGPPAMTVAAVMPLPEGLPELSFAGALGGRRVRMVHARRAACRCRPRPISSSAARSTPTASKPEGPFGDHLGYYSLTHDFPVLQVDRVYHRDGAIWPFTSVGRPPQEDTSFGELIHELTGPAHPDGPPRRPRASTPSMPPASIRCCWRSAASGTSPMPTDRRPQELLTQANAILGQGQMSLAKYLLIVAKEDAPELDIHDVGAFLRHLLERVDWPSDLHFQTRTTIDTLDYSGHGLNQGSKVVIAAAGPAASRRCRPSLPDGLRLPGRLPTPAAGRCRASSSSQGPRYRHDDEDRESRRFCRAIAPDDPIRAFPLIVIVAMTAEFAARSAAAISSG